MDGWARLGSNQRPLACEAHAAFAACRRLTAKPHRYSEALFDGAVRSPSVAVSISHESRTEQVLSRKR